MAMMEIIKTTIKYDFVAKFKICMILSTILVIVSLIGAATKMKYGVDFRGGSEIQVKFSQSVPVASVREALDGGGFKNASVQTIGSLEDNELMIKVSSEESDLNTVSAKVSELLTKNFATAGAEIRKVDIVGPKAGAELRLSGFLAMAWALLSIMIYVSLRFDIKYAPGAIIALFHDVTMVLGAYTLFGIEFTLQTVAALLAIIGYSINDTVIVYDRVREHEDKNDSSYSLAAVINTATNETLARSLLTSATTFTVCLIMLIMGGGAIRDFFFAMIVGIFFGSYSSVFIASAITLWMDGWRKKSTKSEMVAAK
jgi:preprotein translocase subunit SecF